MKRNSTWLGLALLAVSGWLSCARSPQEARAKFLKKGEAFLAQKDYSRALLELQNASKVAPRDAEPVYQMGLTYAARGDFGTAISAFRKALELDPNHAGAKLQLAGLMATSNEKPVLESVEKTLKELVASSRNSAEAMDTLAVTEWKLGKPEDARKLIEQGADKFPADLRASVLLANVKLGRNDPGGAEQALKQAVANAPGSPQAALALGRFYSQVRKPDQAQAELRRALALDPKYAPALFSLALIQLNASRPDQAEQYYQRLAQQPDKDYQSLYGLFLFQQGKIDAALAEFRRLAKEAPGDRALQTQLTTAYVKANKIPEAQKLLAEGLNRNPKNIDALLQRSELRLRAGDFSGAEKDLNQVLNFQQNSAAAHFELAKVRHAQGLVASERQELSDTLRLDPRYLPGRLALCRSFLASNEAVAALHAIDEAPSFQKSQPALAVERNWALIGLKRTGEAREAINQGLREGRKPDLVLQNAVLKMIQRDFAGARADAEELLKLDPENMQLCGLIVNSYAGEKRLPKGIERMRELVSQRPRSAPLQLMLGDVLIEAADRAGAKKAFEAAEAANPKLSRAKLALAGMDLSEHQLEFARRRADAVIASEPRNVSALLLAAAIENAAGNHSAAIARYRSVVEISPSNVTGLNGLAYLLGSEDPDEALKFAEKALELAPDDPAVQDTLGWVYYRKGIYANAVQHLKTAVAKAPTPLHRFHLAMSYIKVGDDQGQRILAAALREDPSLENTEHGW